MKKSGWFLVVLLSVVFAGQVVAGVRKEVRIWVTGNASPGSTNQLSISTTNVPTVHILMQKISDITKIYSGDTNLIGRFTIKKPVKEWDEKLGAGQPSFEYSQRDIYRHKKIKLPMLPAGMYLLTAKGGYNAEKTVVTVTNLAVLVKRSQKQTLVWVTDSVKHNPVSGARVTLLSAYTASKKNSKGGVVSSFNSHTLSTGITGSDGVCIIKSQKSKGNLVMVSKGSDQTIAECKDVKGDGELIGHVQTDRPVYRPGNTLNYKAILRLTKDRAYTPVADTNCKIVIKDPNYTVVDESEAKTNALGTLAGTYEIPSEAATGDYTILVKVGSTEEIHTFTVVEYRKPEYKVTITPEQKRYLSGENVVFKLNAAYYFGASVQQATVRYEVRQSSLRTWENIELSEEPSTYEEERSPGRLISQDTVMTDNSGNAAISIKSIPGAPDTIYYIVCRMTDVSNREVIQNSSVKVYSAGIKISVKSDKDLVMIGSNIPVQLKVTDLDDKPVSSNITLSTQSLVWNNKAKTYTMKQFSSTTVAVPDKGNVMATVPAKTEGELILQATAVDKDGRKSVASTTVWVAGIDAKKVDTKKPPKVIIKLDKKTYNPGETIKALGTTTLSDRPVLITAEGFDVFKYILIPANRRTFKWSIPTSTEMTPNAFVQAIQWSGSMTISDTARVIIPDPSRKLQVKIDPSQTTFKPGSKAEYTIRTLGAKGEPVQAEVSLVAVDESIYAIQTDKTRDLYDTYWGVKENRVKTSILSAYDTFSNMLRQYEEKYTPRGRAGMMGGAGMHEPGMRGMPGMGMPGAPAGEDFGGEAYRSNGFSADFDIFITGKVGIAPTRKTFADTAFWKAQVSTDNTGTARVSFDLPDNLTRWKVVARAITADTRVGTGTTSTQVTQPVTFRLSTPRQFVKGDTLVLKGIINNRTDEDHEFQASLSAVGLTIDGESTRIVKVAANKEGTVQWNVKADTLPDNGKTTITGSVVALDTDDTKDLSDVLQAEVRVLPDGVRNTMLIGGTIGQKATIPLVLPKDRIEPASTVTISINAGLAQVIEDMVASVVEDGMSSVTGPSDLLLALSVSEKPNIQRNIKEALAALYARNTERYNNQESYHYDMYPEIQSTIFTSILRAKERGIKINAADIDQKRQQIQERLRSDGLWERIALLASSGTPFKGNQGGDYLERVHEKRTYLSSFAQLAVAEAYLKQHKDDWAKDTAGKLLESVAVGPDTAYIPAGEHPGWSASTVETTAQALILLTKLPIREELQPKLARWLAEESQTSWLSSHEKALAAYALRCYIDKHPQPTDLGTLAVSVNGVNLGPVPVKGKAAQISVPAGMLKDSDNTITIQRDALGEVFYSIEARTFSRVTDESANEIRVLRRYEVQNTAGLWEEMKGNISTTNPIRCTVVVWPNDRPDIVRVTEPIPSGFEFVESGSSYYATEEVRDSAVIHYMFADKDPVFFRYYLRPESEGIFLALPASAEAIRRPTVRGNSEAMLFTVKG